MDPAAIQHQLGEFAAILLSQGIEELPEGARQLLCDNDYDVQRAVAAYWASSGGLVADTGLDVIVARLVEMGCEQQGEYLKAVVDQVTGEEAGLGEQELVTRCWERLQQKEQERATLMALSEEDRIENEKAAKHTEANSGAGLAASEKLAEEENVEFEKYKQARREEDEAGQKLAHDREVHSRTTPLHICVHCSGILLAGKRT